MQTTALIHGQYQHRDTSINDSVESKQPESTQTQTPTQPMQPLLFANDQQRRKRKQAKLRQHHHNKSNSSHNHNKRKKSYIKNNEILINNTDSDDNKDSDNDNYNNNGHIHGHRTSQSHHGQSRYIHHEPRQSQKDMEDKLAQLYLNPKVINFKKSKSHNALNLNPSSNYKMNRKLHSKSGPQPMGRKKKRTFKLAEPTELTTNRSQDSIISINTKSTKKKSRNFMKELKVTRSASYNTPTPSSPTSSASPSASPPPQLPPFPGQSKSANAYSYSPRSNNNYNQTQNERERVSIRRNKNIIRKKRNSFKLGDEQLKLFRSHDSFESYKTKYNVHKPKIKPGSNQFLVSQKMRELQQRLKDEEKEQREQKEKENMDKNNQNGKSHNYRNQILKPFHNRDGNSNIDIIDVVTMNEINESLGKELDVLKTIKLPNYSSAIPFILIELKKKLYSCDGLKQRKIFHISVKNNTSTHHQIAHILHNFFSHLPQRLLDGVSVFYFKQIISYKQIPDIISMIPDPNKSILLWLWDLLSDTIEYSMLNKMNSDSLSKSFAPLMITNNLNIKLIIKFFKYGIEWRLFLREQNDNLYLYIFLQGRGI